MSTLDAAARDLVSAMDTVLDAMKRMTASNLAELLSTRFKSRVTLGAFLKALDERCSALRGGTEAEAALCRSIDQKVAAVGPMVHDHITKWNPATISADIDGYKSAVGHMQRDILSIIAQAQRLPR